MFHHKKISIVGFGKSGASAAHLLARRHATLFVSESNRDAEQAITSFAREVSVPVHYEVGGHTERILDADMIVLSPGVSPKEPVIQKAIASGIEMVSELELGYRCLKETPAYIIAITGTNGKTTVTTLCAEICKQYNSNTVCCGNIGVPLTSVVEEVTRNTIVVVEVSSYQLEHIKHFHANAAAVLNVTPDHLARYASLEGYAQTKAKIFQLQTPRDVGVYNLMDPYRDIARAALQGNAISFSREKGSGNIFYDAGYIHFPALNWRYDCSQLKIPGMHNVENVMASVGLCVNFVKQNIRILDDVLSSFAGVAHRIERVREINGVLFVNDSKATNVDSTDVALKSFEQPLIVLMGGRDKGAPYAPLAEQIKKKVKNIIAFGEGRQRIFDELSKYTHVALENTLDEAVHAACTIAQPGDVVLLSPACASFDQFDNFEQRGDYFKKIVAAL